MSYESLFKLKTNPFRLIPANKPEEIIWAGFHDIKNKFEQIITRATKLQNSSLILNWGEYGSGKTHAARFFNRKDILANIAASQSTSVPYSLLLTLPKGKNPVYDIFVSVIDKLDISSIRTLFDPIKTEILSYIDVLNDNLHIRSVLKAIFENVNSDILKKYLYGNISTTELRDLSANQILRILNDGDYTKILAGLFSCLTYKEQHFSTIIIWIDEFEDIGIYNSINQEKTNNFIRELLDSTPNNLLMMLNLTQSALVNIEDLGEYLTDAVRSRIKDRVEFKIPNEAEFINYLNELLNDSLYRTEVTTNPLYPFEEITIKSLIKELDNVSIRKFNDALSLLLEIAFLENRTPIDEAFFKANQKEIIGWK